MSSVLDRYRFDRIDTLREPSAWLGHIPFGKFLIGTLAPELFVELGTHYGHSYFAFCDSVRLHNLSTKCFAVDTWKGDEHTGSYDDTVYSTVASLNSSQFGEFSTLLRMTFDEAVSHFRDGSIDLLHIDGTHTYEAVKHDFETWFPKLSRRAVVLFHDINVRDPNFGVWKYWDEITKEYVHLNFAHSAGLGVLFVGENQAEGVTQLLDEWSQRSGQRQLRNFFANMGRYVEVQWRNQQLLSELSDHSRLLEAVKKNLAESENRCLERQHQIEELNGEVARLRNQLRETTYGLRDTEETKHAISALHVAVVDTDTRVKVLTQLLSEREKEIGVVRRARELEFESREHQLASRVSDLENLLATKEQELESRESTFASRISGLENLLGERDAQIAEISSQLTRTEQMLSSLLHSTTWTLTEPLRMAGRVARRLLRRTPTGVSNEIAVSATPSSPNSYSLAMPISTGGLTSALRTRWSQLSPLPIYTVPGGDGGRVNLVTDSINAGSLFGGVGTAIMICAMLAESRGETLRVITRTEPADEGNLWNVLRQNGIRLAQDVEFIFVPPGAQAQQLDLRQTDTFVTTSWWTTQSALGSVPANQIVYLLQEDERMFYPYGDDHLKCETLLKNENIKFVINTKLLYEHLVNSGLRSIARNGMWFEPAFSSKMFYPSVEKKGVKRELMFYARPNNLRNLFYFGIQVIQEAVTRGVLNLNEWDIVFVGKDIPDVTLDDGYRPKIYENLGWAEYGSLIRRIDLGLCLMYTPHPSYPPLDLAASGAVVITNSFGEKKSLNNYSANIICAELELESMLDSIAAGIGLVSDTETRIENYQNAHIRRDWTESLKDVVARLTEVL